MMTVCDDMWSLCDVVVEANRKTAQKSTSINHGEGDGGVTSG